MRNTRILFSFVRSIFYRIKVEISPKLIMSRLRSRNLIPFSFYTVTLKSPKFLRQQEKEKKNRSRLQAPLYWTTIVDKIFLYLRKQRWCSQLLEHPVYLNVLFTRAPQYYYQTKSVLFFKTNISIVSLFE